MADPNVLPNSRLREAKESTRIRAGFKEGGSYMNWVPIFCANCGKSGGFVPEDHSQFAFWLCDNCVDKFGPIAATMQVPDEVFWEKVKQDKRQGTK